MENFKAMGDNLGEDNETLDGVIDNNEENNSGDNSEKSPEYNNEGKSESKGDERSSETHSISSPVATTPVSKDDKSSKLKHYNPQIEDKINVSIDENLINDLLKSVYLNETPEMVTTDWVGNSNLLLQYIVDMQDKYKLTLPLDSLGIATSMFDKIETDTNGYFTFQDRLYELIEIDGSCYLSCITKEINRGRFKRITQQMLSDLCDIGTFTLKRTSFNIFSVDNSNVNDDASIIAVSDVRENVLTRSLTLNTFEMQALYAYIEKLGGVEVTHSEDEDGFAIMIVKYTD